jgi:RNA polymerase sigma-70 factor, ECF subfamily
MGQQDMPARFQDTPEAEVVGRAINGDQEAFGDLYEKYLDAIFRYIYYRVNNHHEAEDLTETVFLKAWEALGSYRLSNVPFKAWLYRIAHNLVIDLYRTQKQEAPLDGHTGFSDDGQSPEEQVVWLERTEQLLAAMAGLDEDHRQVLSLRFINELSHAETAYIMNRSEGAVRVLQHRALNALRHCLASRAGL